MESYREYLIKILADDTDQITPEELRVELARSIVGKLTDQEVARTFLALNKVRADTLREVGVR